MTKKINDVMWGNAGWFPFHFGFCPNEKAWDQQMKKWGRKTPYPTTAAMTCVFRNVKHKNMAVLVTLADDGHKDTDIVNMFSLIAHEATHVWQFLCLEIGEDNPSIECEAYAIQNICRDLMAAVVLSRKIPSRVSIDSVLNWR